MNTETEIDPRQGINAAVDAAIEEALSEQRSRLDRGFTKEFNRIEKWWSTELKNDSRHAAENSEKIKTRYRWSRARWAIAMLLIGLIVGCFFQKIGQSIDATGSPTSSGTWDEGFRDGMAYTIDKYVDGDLLKTPQEVSDRTVFHDCIFVSVSKPPPILSLTGRDCIVSGCTLGTGLDPIQRRPIPMWADEAFENLTKKQKEPPQIFFLQDEQPLRGQ